MFFVKCDIKKIPYIFLLFFSQVSSQAIFYHPNLWPLSLVKRGSLVGSIKAKAQAVLKSWLTTNFMLHCGQFQEVITNLWGEVEHLAQIIKCDLTLPFHHLHTHVAVFDKNYYDVREGPLIRALFVIRTTFKFRWVGGLEIRGRSNWSMKKKRTPLK